MKLFKQKFTSIFLAAAFLLGVVLTVNFALKTEAATLNSGSFTIVTPSDPLFSDINIAPGYLNTKTIQVTNNSDSAKDFSVALSNLNGELKDVLKIKTEVNGTLKWDKVLTDIAVDPNNEFVASVPGGQTVNITFSAYLLSNVGDYNQNKSVSFDWVMGSSTIEYLNPSDVLIIEPLVPPVVNFTSETGSSAGQTGGTADQPASTGIGAGELALGTAGVNPETPVITENPPAGTGEVLGTTTKEARGEETSGKNICFWWWFLSIVYALFLIIYGSITYKKEIIFGWVWPVLAGAVFYLLHWYLHCFYAPSGWCHYFVWFELGELIIYFILYSYFRNRALKEKE